MMFIRLGLLAAAFGLASPTTAQSIEPLRPKILAALPAMPSEEIEDPRRILGPGLFLHHAPLREAMSEDNHWFVGEQDGTLTIREAGGEPTDLARPDAPYRWTAEGAKLSADGRWIAAKMIDDSKVYETRLADTKGGTRVVKFSYAGQPIPEKRLFVLSRNGAIRVEIPLTMDYVYIAGFDEDGRALRYLESDRISRHVALRRFDFDSGAVETLMEESSDDWNLAGYDLGDGYSTRFEATNRLVLLDDDRFLWTSDRSGRTRTYLYAERQPPRALPVPPGELQLDLVGVDRKARVAIIKTAADDQPGAAHRLHAIDLGSLTSRRILKAPYISWAEMGSGTVTSVITDLPATLTLRTVDFSGRQVGDDRMADLDFLAAEPATLEKLVLPGADGTPLHALLVSPRGIGRFPLVDYLYGGPQTEFVPRDPAEPAFAEALIMARRGIGTVFIDARGTPGRDAPFAHAQDGRFGAVVIPDHKAAIRELLARNPRIDAGRMGIMGHSWGGYFALRGMIEGNDLYRAGILLAPNTNASEMRVPVEAFQGCVPADCPDAYAQGDLTTRVSKLRGPLLIIHGQADDDVLPEVTDKLEADLSAAGKEYEIVRPPNAHHIVMREPDFLDRIVGFWTKVFAR